MAKSVMPSALPMALPWCQRHGYAPAGMQKGHVLFFHADMGRPVIQLPEDMLRIQEVIYADRPTLIIETGVAHGGSLIFYASLFKAMDFQGRVVGIDIEIGRTTVAP